MSSYLWPTKKFSITDQSPLLWWDHDSVSSSALFSKQIHMHGLKFGRTKSTSRSSGFTDIHVYVNFLNHFFEIKTFRATKWAFAFEILVCIVSCGLQIDQSRGGNRLSHIINMMLQNQSILISSWFQCLAPAL